MVEDYLQDANETMVELRTNILKIYDVEKVTIVPFDAEKKQLVSWVILSKRGLFES